MPKITEIKCGGAIRIMGTKVDYNINLFKMWYEKNQKRAIENLKLPKIKNNENLLKALVKEFKLNMTCINFLAVLHESIVEKYLTIIDEYVSKNPDFKIIDVNESQPSNYTINMARLKNLRFSIEETNEDWDGSKIKGFCPLEPVERIKQLLDFPIEQFGEIYLPVSLEIFNIKPPSLDIKKEKINSKKIYENIINLIPELKKWELYYDNLSTAIKELIDNL